MGGDPHDISKLVRHDVSAVQPQGAYLAKRSCPVVAQNDTLYPGEQRAPDALGARLISGGITFEAEVFADLANLGALLIEEESSEDLIGATRAAMDARTPIILGGQLPTDHANKRVGKPDVLVAAAEGGYRAGDVKHHLTLQAARTPYEALIAAFDDPAFEHAHVDAGRYARKNRTNEEDLLQLAHYQRMLEACGHAAPDGRHGAVIGRERVLVWYDLDLPAFQTTSQGGKRKRRSVMERYDFEFAFRLDVVATALEHLRDPSVPLKVQPARVSACERCGWHDLCLEELSKNSGDVSLVPGVNYKDWRQHLARGVRDRAQLAALSIDDPRYADWKGSTLAKQIVEARAWLGPERFYLRPGVKRLDLPRADVEIDVDLESTETAVYLWGALHTDRAADNAPVFHAFASWEPMTKDEEARTFADFWSWLASKRRNAASSGKSLHVYHYGDIERTAMRRIAASAGAADDVEAFLANEQCIDLCATLSKRIATGTAFGLKVIAPLAGFGWEVEEADGASSMFVYERAIGDDPDDAEAAKQWLLAYNRNDVEATLAIRDALERHPPKPL